MAGEETKVSSITSSNQVDTTLLSDEEKQKLEARRSAQTNATRDQLLTDSISGNNKEMKKAELEAQYQKIRAEKSNLQAMFNTVHADYVQPKHSEYVQALTNRAKKGWAKLAKSDIWNASKQMYEKFTLAGKNLSTTGTLGNVKLDTNLTDRERLTSYVSNQEFIYGKQTKVDLANYELAQEEFHQADENTNLVDGELTFGIGYERDLVGAMRNKDQQLRNNIIAQNYLA